MVDKKTLKAQLIAAYDADAQRRMDNANSRAAWKVAARKKFANLVKAEGKITVLELGAGAGLDSVYFKGQGLDVLATDISPKMVELCRQNGLNAAALDLYEVGNLHRQFDAIYSLNVLLHVPKDDLHEVLGVIHNALTPDGIFFYGVYGGTNKETVFTDPKRMNLPRFFSFFDDKALQHAVAPLFKVISSDTVDVNDESGLHFQSLLLRKK